MRAEGNYLTLCCLDSTITTKRKKGKQTIKKYGMPLAMMWSNLGFIVL